MNAWSRHLRPAARYCADCAGLLACWAVWLALGALLAVQIAIAVSHEFALPGFVLRALEQRFAASHIDARFGRATFNPTGGVLLENLQLTLPEFEEPVIRARAVYVDLDPWSLLAGRFEARRIYATGLQLFVPGMLAPSGHSEEILRDLEFTLVPGADTFVLEHLAARFAGVALTAHGAFQLQRSGVAGPLAPLPFLASLPGHYAALSHQLVLAAAQLAALEQPELDIALSPSPTRGAIARVTLTARRLTLPKFHDLTGREIRVVTRFPLLGETPAMVSADVAVGELRLGGLAAARQIHAHLRGVLNPGRFSYQPRTVELTADDVSARGFSLQNVAARIQPRPLPRLAASLVAACDGRPVALRGDADLAAKTARLHFSGALSPALLDPIGAAIGRDVRRFIGFGEPVRLNVDARFGAGWKFERVFGHAWMRQIDAYHVPIDAAHGEIDFDGRHFVARHAFAALGDNFARGRFEQDLKTKEFRFLLEGRLRPLAISGWFREWWPNFFENFAFPDAPPAASVDVAGRWFSPHETTVFVAAAGAGAVVRGARFDTARTLLFIRPNFIDGFEIFGTRGAGEVSGTFRRFVNPADNEWTKLTFALTSSIDLDAGAKVLGPVLAARLAPFAFQRPPHLRVSGDFDGPAAPAGEHQTMRIEAQSTGGFSLYRFPAENLSFNATLHDGDLAIEDLTASAAGGALSGRARVFGPDRARRLGFDATLRGANLDRAVSAVTEYAAQRRGRPATATEKILSGQGASKLDLSVSAEGRFDDPLSYHGTGSAALAGELGEVRLLGLLSELLNFTALRFTAAHADFKIQGTKIVFPSVSVTGANSAIEAHGDYLLDRRELDFNARVYPFQESKSLLQSVVGAVLTPFSAVLEVKLTGPLDQPKWAFVIGPTNLLRSLSQPAPPAPATETPDQPSPYLKR